jgi:carnitine 3-dehydrogenase
MVPPPSSHPEDASPIQRVAVIGTGVIGASWCAAFLAHGLEVQATDPAPGAEARLRSALAAMAPAMAALGLSLEGAEARLRFVATPEEAAAGADLVQENAPERLDVKREIFARLDAAAPPGALLASSTSTIPVSSFQDAARHHPERIVLAHPFNPPHLIPLVEVGGGRATAEAAIVRALAFYRRIGKHPIRLKKEIRGHIANRLQFALWREAIHLLREGVAEVADIDAAIAHGPGLRWALLGPFLNLHLSGGEGGIAALFEKPLWREVEETAAELGPARPLTPDEKRRIAEGVAAEMARFRPEAMQESRDRVLTRLLGLKQSEESLP